MSLGFFYNMKRETKNQVKNNKKLSLENLQLIRMIRGERIFMHSIMFVGWIFVIFFGMRLFSLWNLWVFCVLLFLLILWYIHSYELLIIGRNALDELIETKLLQSKDGGSK